MLDIWLCYTTLGCDRNRYCLYNLHRVLLHYYTQHKLPTSPEVLQIFRGCLLSCFIRHPVMQHSQSALTVATTPFTHQQSVNTLVLLKLYRHSRGCLWTRQLRVREVPVVSSGTSFYVEWNSQCCTTEINHWNTKDQWFTLSLRLFVQAQMSPCLDKGRFGTRFTAVRRSITCHPSLRWAPLNPEVYVKNI